MEFVLSLPRLFPRSRPFRGAAKFTALAALVTLSGVGVQPAKSLPLQTGTPGQTTSPASLPRPRRRLPATLAKFPRVAPVKDMMTGFASWYGKVLQGHHTASGERFDANGLTGAHRTLPFGTLVRVTDLFNHRTVVVKITDRGALNANRAIDLSYGAAKALDMVRAGTHPVSLEVVASTEPQVVAPAEALVN